jgi:hypothetical protein
MPRTILGIDHGGAGDSERRDTGEKYVLHANLLCKVGRRWARFDIRSTYSLARVRSVTKM